MQNYNKVMVTMLGLLIIAFSLNGHSFIFATLIEIIKTSNLIYLVALVILYVFPLFIGIYLFVKPQILTKFIKINFSEKEDEINLTNTLTTAIVILGLFIATYAFIYLMQEAIRLTFLLNESDVNVETTIMSGEKKAELLSYCVELMIGLLMAFKAKKIANFFSRK